jgi:hypothetical protein
MADKPVTDFPEDGGVRQVSLRTSSFKVFDLRFALDLRKNYPSLWKRGGDLAGNDQFEALIPVQRRGGSIRNAQEEAAVRQREAWARDHFSGVEIDDVVAQIRWLVIGKLGIDRMKALVAETKELGKS